VAQEQEHGPSRQGERHDVEEAPAQLNVVDIGVREKAREERDDDSVAERLRDVLQWHTRGHRRIGQGVVDGRVGEREQRDRQGRDPRRREPV